MQNSLRWTLSFPKIFVVPCLPIPIVELPRRSTVHHVAISTRKEFLFHRGWDSSQVKEEARKGDRTAFFPPLVRRDRRIQRLVEAEKCAILL